MVNGEISRELIESVFLFQIIILKSDNFLAIMSKQYSKKCVPQCSSQHCLQ